MLHKAVIINFAYLTSCATAAPVAESQIPTRPLSNPIDFPKKLQPRGAAERQSYSDLREFLKLHRANPEDDHHTQVVKSTFDWDGDDGDEDEDSSLQVRDSNLQSLHRITRRWQAAMVGGGKVKETEGLHGTGLAVDAWMASAQKYAEGRGVEAVTSSVKNESERGSPTAGCAPLGVKRKSVMKLFDDPVWSNEDGKSLLSVPKVGIC